VGSKNIEKESAKENADKWVLNMALWNKNIYGKKSSKEFNKRQTMRTCCICGKQAVKGRYCQSCAEFIRKMQKREQSAQA
jgi:hypothetical protein